MAWIASEELLPCSKEWDGFHDDSYMLCDLPLPINPKPRKENKKGRFTCLVVFKDSSCPFVTSCYHLGFLREKYWAETLWLPWCANIPLAKLKLAQLTTVGIRTIIASAGFQKNACVWCLSCCTSTDLQWKIFVLNSHYLPWPRVFSDLSLSKPFIFSTKEQC